MRSAENIKQYSKDYYTNNKDKILARYHEKKTIPHYVCKTCGKQFKNGRLARTHSHILGHAINRKFSPQSY
jgi:hypothetical protein